MGHLIRLATIQKFLHKLFLPHSRLRLRLFVGFGGPRKLLAQVGKVGGDGSTQALDEILFQHPIDDGCDDRGDENKDESLPNLPQK